MGNDQASGLERERRVRETVSDSQSWLGERSWLI